MDAVSVLCHCLDLLENLLKSADAPDPRYILLVQEVLFRRGFCYMELEKASNAEEDYSLFLEVGHGLSIP